MKNNQNDFVKQFGSIIEASAFITFDFLTFNMCKQAFKKLPGIMILLSIKQQGIDPLEQQVQDFVNQLRQLARKFPYFIYQLIGYPPLFVFLLYLLNQNFQSYIMEIQDEQQRKSTQNMYQNINIGLGVFYTLTYLVSPGFFNSKEDIEELQSVMQNQPELKYNPKIMCEPCNQPRIIRSKHCYYCQHCVAKHEYHSTVFNKCIGAGNLPLYLGFCLFMCLFTGFQFSMILKIKKENSLSSGKLPLLINFRILFYYSTLLIQHILLVLVNITFNEFGQFGKLAYLWKNPQLEFYNPFNKGIFGNLRELLLVLYTSKGVKQRYTQIEEEVQEKKNDFNIRDFKDSDDSLSDEEEEKEDSQKAQNDKIKEIEKIGLQTIQQEKYYNWKTKKMFTLLDIYNSPMRGVVRQALIRQLKKELKNNEIGIIEFQHIYESRVLEQKLERGLIKKNEFEMQQLQLTQQFRNNKNNAFQKILDDYKSRMAINPNIKNNIKQQFQFQLANLLIQQNDSNVINNQGIQEQIEMNTHALTYLFGPQEVEEVKAKLNCEKEESSQLDQTINVAHNLPNYVSQSAQSSNFELRVPQMM